MAKRQKMSEGASDELTILDYLNEDCWREVLRHVPARDVMRTERASRRWQGVVLRYLREVHIRVGRGSRNKIKFNACILTSGKYTSFEMWTSKLGSSVVATYCNSWESLETIRVNCPNLKSLRLVDMRDFVPERLPRNLNDDFKFLKRLGFSSCSVSDHWVNQFVADKALEQLEFIYCDEVTGHCLNTLNSSNLKSLAIESGDKLSVQHVVSSVRRLGQLTELKLDTIDSELAEEIQSELDKMPKLKRLTIYSDERTYCATFEPLSRLTSLKHLCVSMQLSDDGVEAVLSSCKELRTFELDCRCMWGVEAIARHGARLTSLTLRFFYDLDDDGVVAIIRGCRKLKSLDLSGTRLLSPALPARAQAAHREARPRPRLQLDLMCSNLEDGQFLDSYEGEEYDNMERLYEDMIAKYEDLVIVIGSENEEEEDDDDDDDDDGEDSE